MKPITRLLTVLALITFPLLALAQEAAEPAAELGAHELAARTIEAFDKGQYQIGAALFVVLIAGLIRMGAVKLPGKLGEAAASKWGGRLIAIVVAQGGAIVTAMAAGKKVTPGLIMAGLIAGWLGSGMRSHAPRRKKKAKAAAPAVAALLVAALGLQITGCAAVYDNARRAQGVASRTVKAAGQAWEKYDQARLDQIKAETPNGAERTKRILEYANGEHAEVVKVINTATKAIDAIDRLLDGVEAASKKDIAAALAAAAGAVDAVIDMLTKLGIKLPSEVL